MYPKPKKSLGQNFLVDNNIKQKIITACQLKPSDTVLEIGPGTGELTRLISPRVKQLYAFEIDSRLYPQLKKEFSDCSNTEIINKDILKVKLEEYIKDRIKVIGNIPYYISTPIIEKFLSYKQNVDTIFLTVQKEFAERVAASPGSKKYGALSCFIQYHARPQLVFKISSGCFFPRPKVDSYFLELKILATPSVEVNDEEAFFHIIRTAFNQRRKTLKNSLKNTIPKEKMELFFTRFTINPNIRPEDLSLQDFAKLANV